MRRSTGDGPAFPTTRCRGDTPVDRHFLQLQANDQIVGGECHRVDCWAIPSPDHSFRRRQIVRSEPEPLVPRAVHQGVDDVLEHHPARDPPTVTTQRMIWVELRRFTTAVLA